MATSAPQIFSDAVVGLPTIAHLDVACSNEVCKQSFREYLPRVRGRLSQAGCTWNQPVQVHDGEFVERNRVTHMMHCSCGGTYRALIGHSRTNEVRERNAGELSHLSKIAHVNMIWVLACLTTRTLLPTAGAVMLRATPHVGTENANLVDGRLGVYPREVNISCSGFKSCSRYLVEIMCHALGVNFQHNMHLAPSEAGPKTDLLIVFDNSETAVRNSEKLTRAWQSNIPVVNFLWLVDSYVKWDLQPLDDPKYVAASGDAHVNEGIKLLFAGNQDAEAQRLGGFGMSHETVTCGDPTEDELDGPMDQLGGLLAIEEDEFQKPQWSGSGGVSGANSGDNTKDDGTGEMNEDPARASPGTLGVVAAGAAGAAGAEMAGPGKRRAKEAPEHAKEGKVSRKGRSAKASADVPGVRGEEDRVRGANRAGRANEKQKAASARDAGDSTRVREDEELSVHLTVSGMHSGEQKEVLPLMRSLGVPYSVGSHSWNDKFTHIIAPSVRRNQKMLSALACGRWIVSPEFLRASVNKSKLALTGPSKLVPEKKYELKEGNSHHGIDDNVARFWRERTKSSGCRAFEGLVTSIHSSITSRHAPSKEDIKAILRAGGATVVPWIGITDVTLGARTGSGQGLDLVVCLETHTEHAREDLDLRLGTSSVVTGRRPKRPSTKQMPVVFSSIEIIQWLVSLKTKLQAQDGSKTLNARLLMREETR